MNHITWIEEADRFYILLNGLVVLFLLEELIGVLFDNLALDFTGEVRLLRYGLGLSVVRLLHQVVNLDIVFHWVELDELSDYILTLVTDLSNIIDALLALGLLNLNINDRAVSRWVPEHSDLVFKVVDRELG